MDYKYSSDTDNLVIEKVWTDGEVDRLRFSDIPVASQHFIICYGLRQYLSDCHSGKNDIGDKKAETRKAIERLEMGTPRATRQTVDWAKLSEVLVELGMGTVGDIEQKLADNFIPAPDEEPKVKRLKAARLKKLKAHPQVAAAMGWPVVDTIDDLL